MESRHSERGRIAGLGLVMVVVVLLIALIPLWAVYRNYAGGGPDPDDYPPPVSGVLPEVEATEFDGEQMVQQVSVGATSEMYAEITDGLVEGDIVLLNAAVSQPAQGGSTQERAIRFQGQGGQGMPAGFPGGAP